MQSNANRTSTYGWNLIDSKGHSRAYLTDAQFANFVLEPGWVAYPLAVQVF